MRLINADAIVYESIDSCDTGRHESYYGTGILAVRKDDIDDMPTIEPEWKKGKWERHYCEDGNPDGWQCNQCAEWYYFGDMKPNFCPNCGAKMEEQNG